VEFVNAPVEDTPEGKTLLGMQGPFDEYRRAKILESTRRGKLYWAKQGAVVGGRVPYGYRLVKRSDRQRASLVLDPEAALVVSQLFAWLAEEGLSTRAIARRLTERGVPTAAGARQWQPTAVHRMLNNPGYQGEWPYQRTQRTAPVPPGQSVMGRDARKTRKAPRLEEEWISIPVPAIVDVEQWERAQAQLQTNAQRSRRNNTRNFYLLRGLIRCSRCNGTFVGVTQHGYRRYRCVHTDATVSSTGTTCRAGSVGADVVETAVWEAVEEALRQPDALIQEYQRRCAAIDEAADGEPQEKQVALALKRLRVQEDRLTDAYLNEVFDLSRYKEEMLGLQARQRQLENTRAELAHLRQRTMGSRQALKELETFCVRVAEGLEQLTLLGRRELRELVVERMHTEDQMVYVDTIIPVHDTMVICVHLTLSLSKDERCYGSTGRSDSEESSDSMSSMNSVSSP